MSDKVAAQILYTFFLISVVIGTPIYNTAKGHAEEVICVILHDQDLSESCTAEEIVIYALLETNGVMYSRGNSNLCITPSNRNHAE